MKEGLIIPNNSEVLSGLIEGVVLDEGLTPIIIIGEDVETGETFYLTKEELESNIAVIGYTYDTISTNLRLIEERWEVGDNYLILDYNGLYTRLMHVIPSLRVFRAGIDFSIRLFDHEPLDIETYKHFLTNVMTAYLRLGNTEQRLLYTAITELYERFGQRASILDFIITIRDLEETPTLTAQEYSKIDSLMRAIAPLLKGRTATAFSHEPQIPLDSLFEGINLIDLSRIAPEYRSIIAALILMKCLKVKKSCTILISEAQALFPEDRDQFLTDLYTIIDKAHLKGISLHISSTTLSSLSSSIINRIGLLLVHRTLNYQDLRLLSQLCHRYAIQELYEGETLILSRSRGVIKVRVYASRSQEFEVPTDNEIEEHMEKLGIRLTKLKEMELPRITLLERDFREYAEYVYKLLRALTEQIMTRGEAISLLKDEGLSTDIASQLLDATQILGYLKEDYVSGRRILVLTRKAVLAIDEYEAKVKAVEARDILKNIKGRGDENGKG